MTRRAKTPEAYVLDAILSLLQVERVLAFRLNVGTMHIGERYVRFGVQGMADVIAFPAGRPVLWIECKAPDGRQSQLQKSFQRQVEEAGHTYILARSIEDVLPYI